MKVVQQWNPIRPVFIIEDAVSWTIFWEDIWRQRLFKTLRPLPKVSKSLGQSLFHTPPKYFARREKRFWRLRVHLAPGIAAVRSPSTFTGLKMRTKLRLPIPSYCTVVCPQSIPTLRSIGEISKKWTVMIIFLNFVSFLLLYAFFISFSDWGDLKEVDRAGWRNVHRRWQLWRQLSSRSGYQGNFFWYLYINCMILIIDFLVLNLIFDP